MNDLIVKMAKDIDGNANYVYKNDEELIKKIKENMGETIAKQILKEIRKIHKKSIIEHLYKLAEEYPVIVAKAIMDITNQPHKNEKYIRYMVVYEELDGEKLKNPYIIENDCGGDLYVYKDPIDFAEQCKDNWHDWYYQDLQSLSENIGIILTEEKLWKKEK